MPRQPMGQELLTVLGITNVLEGSGLYVSTAVAVGKLPSESQFRRRRAGAGAELWARQRGSPGRRLRAWAAVFPSSPPGCPSPPGPREAASGYEEGAFGETATLPTLTWASCGREVEGVWKSFCFALTLQRSQPEQRKAGR